MNTNDLYVHKKTLRYYIAAIVAAALAAFLPTAVLSASGVSSQNYISGQYASGHYYYFENPAHIASENGSVYILDEKVSGAELAVFSDSGQKLRKAPVASGISGIYVCGGRVFALKGGGVSSYIFDSDEWETTLTETDVIPAPIGGNIEAITVDDYTIFALSGGKIISYNRSTLAETVYFSAYAVKQFTKTSDRLYALCGGDYKDEILYFYDFETKKYGTAADGLSGVENIGALGSDVVILSAGGNIVRYTKGISSLSPSYSLVSQRAQTISCSSDSVYVLSELKSVLKYDALLKSGAEIAMSSGAALGFYRNPSSVSSRFNRVVVTDRSNNRVVIDNGSVLSEFKDLKAPSASCTDNTGRIWIAYDENKLAVIASDQGDLKVLSSGAVTVKESSSAEAHSQIVITSVCADSDNNLLILSSGGGLYIRQQDGVFLKISDGVYALSRAVDSNFVYVVKDNGADEKEVVKLTFSLNSAVFSAPVATIDETVNSFEDIAADNRESFYALYQNNHIARFEASGAAYTITSENDIDGAQRLTKISVSNIDYDTANSGPALPDYRDILATDALTHTVRIISCADFGVTYSDPSAVLTKADISSVKYEESNPCIIYSIKNENGANVFAQDSEVKIISVLPKGFKVIVPKYDASAAYTRIIADRLSGSASDEPIIGYVNTENLSAPLFTYAAPPVQECHVWLSEVSVYKLPLRQSPAFTTAQAQSFSLLPFAYSSSRYGYQDNFPENENSKANNVWYRISFEESGTAYEGFVLASSVSILGGNPDLNIRPQTNAVIIAKDKKEPDIGANVYYYDANSDEYIQYGHEYNYLEVGTKVEVAGAFDQSLKYTKILYYTQYGTMEGFVETANIRYQGISLAQIIAVIIIVIVVIVIILLLVRWNVIRKRKQSLSK